MGRPHARSKRINCTNQLKQIGLAFKQWALDQNDKFPMQVPATNGGTMELVGSGIAYVHYLVLSNELNTPKILICPTDTNRLAATNWSSLRNHNLSYFVGLNADDTNPQSFLAGDDNIAVANIKPGRGLLELWTNSPVAWMTTRHIKQGNVGLADGSVQGYSNSRLREALCYTGMSTNRLVIP